MAIIFLLMTGLTALNAAVIDELNYVNEKTDIYAYINFLQIYDFLGRRGVDLKELDAQFSETSGSETDRIINGFGVKSSDIKELLLAVNTEDIEKKSGYLVFISFAGNKGFIPEEFKKNSIKLKSGTAYRASVEDDVVFTRIDDFFVIGPTGYMETYLERRAAKQSLLTARSSLFTGRAAASSVFFQMTVSGFIKKALDDAMNNGAGMARGLRENVFIQTILSLESMDWGMEINDKVVFKSVLTGSKPEDSERLQMLCHTWIVGSSFVVSFADVIAARSEDKTLNELTDDQQLMSWLQRAFGRIHVNRSDKGVITTFEMTSSETDVMVSFIKKELDKAKQARLDRIEREKISKLTLAVSENNVENVTKYIREKYNLNGFNTDGNTPLGVAVQGGNIKIARLLIDNGAKVNAPDVDSVIPLHHAVKSGNKEMTVFLIGKGGDINLKDNSGMTSLHYNAQQGNSEITRILLAKGAMINAADDYSSTPLHYAAASGLIETVKVLAEKKADPEVINKDGYRAIDIAAQNGHEEVVNYMKNIFRQEPKSISGDDYNSSEDSEIGDEISPADESDGDIEENVE